MTRFKSIAKSTFGGAGRGLFALALALLLNVCASAQQTSRYVYDDDGRLHAVIAPNGEAAVYEYDAAGNFKAVRRLAADALELLTFAPRSGMPGTRVVFYGVGFGAGVSAVNFGGGVAGTLVGFDNNTVTALVPEGAATGLVNINTARGTVTTAAPFVVQGVILTPRETSVPAGGSVQFSATVIAPGDEQGVVWKVGGIEGGNDALGRITEAGLYTAPDEPPASFDVAVQAESLALPTLIGTADVHVRSFSDFLFTLSPGVSVGKGDAFRNGLIFGRGVSVGKGGGFQGGGTFGPGVSLTKGPIITSVSPGGLTQGSQSTVTINGLNFVGANGVKLYDADGNQTGGVNASNINVGAGGTSLTVTLNVETFSSLGRKLVVVTTPTAHSLRIDAGINTIQLNAP